MLGPQFDHTYWHEGDEQIQMHKGTVSGRDPVLSGYSQQQRTPPRASDEDWSWMNESRRAKGIQGSLFSPYVGTGLKEDPTVSEEARRSAISDALPKVSGYEGVAGLLHETAYHSDMPTHEFRRLADEDAVRRVSVGESDRGAHFQPQSRNMVLETARAARPLAHEMGHAADPNTRNSWNHRQKLHYKYDPVEEGIADGRADRYSTHDFDPRSSEDAAARQESRMKQVGYTEKRFGDDLHAALYNSTRHVSMLSDRGSRSLPSREALFDDRVERYNPSKPDGGLFQGHPDIPYDEGTDQSDRRIQRSMDKIMMGHIVENHPDSLSTLNDAQMSAAKGAHEYYKRTAPRAFFDHPGEEYHQEKLF